jgi:hypothetical protein
VKHKINIELILKRKTQKKVHYSAKKMINRQMFFILMLGSRNQMIYFRKMFKKDFMFCFAGERAKLICFSRLENKQALFEARTKVF